MLFRNPILERFFFASLIGLALVIRCLFILHLHPPQNHLSSDMGSYFKQAEHLVEGTATAQTGGFSAYFKPQGYHFFVALSVLLGKKQIFSEKLDFLSFCQLLFSFLIPLVMWAAVRPWLGRVNAVIVLIIALFHFPFIHYAGFVMAEIPFTLLLAFLTWGLLKFRFPWKWWQGALLGLVWGVSVIVKGQSSLFPVVAALYSLFFRQVRLLSFRDRLKHVVPSWFFFAIAGCIPLGLHVAHLYQFEHRLVFSPTASGLNFYASKSPECRRFIGSDGVTACSPAYHQTNGCGKGPTCSFDTTLDNGSFFWREGWKKVFANPSLLFVGMHQALKLFVGNEAFPIFADDRYRDLNRLYEFLYVLFIFPGLLLGLLGSFFRNVSDRARFIFVLAWIAIFPYLFLMEAELRFRIPFDVVLIPLSIWGWSHGLKSIVHRSVWLRSPAAIYFWLFLFAPWMTYAFIGKLIQP
jgi:hypothetical protein